MLRFLQKRKFRLVTQWKRALKDHIGFQLPIHGDFPFRLIFRCLDEVIYLLKHEELEQDPWARPAFVDQLDDEHPPTADQYMELFLSGREILVGFMLNDPSFCKWFPLEEREKLCQAVEQAIKTLIQREMTSYSRRYQHTY
jgi:hypothetical protein